MSENIDPVGRLASKLINQRPRLLPEVARVLAAKMIDDVAPDRIAELVEHVAAVTAENAVLREDVRRQQVAMKSAESALQKMQGLSVKNVSLARQAIGYLAASTRDQQPPHAG